MKQAKVHYGLPSAKEWGKRRKMAELALPFTAAIPFLAGVCGFPVPEALAVLPVANLVYRQLASWSEHKPPFTVHRSKDLVKGAFIDLGTTEHGGNMQIPFDKLSRHILLLGTTGSGKTTLIRKMLWSIMHLGGGATFVDGKSDTTDTYEVFVQLVEECGRADDFFVLNFLSPGQSNSLNPLLYGDDDFCTELCAVFLPEASGDGAYWQQRGLALMRGLMSVLVWQRETMGKLFSFWDLKRAITLDNMVELARQIEDGKIPKMDAHTGKPLGNRLISYLEDLGPWKELLKPEPDPGLIDQVMKQHGFAVQQWSSALDLLGGTYSQIFNTHNPDIDMVDIISNSRILYVLLPSLGKSEATLKQMGKLILSVVKVALNELLGKETIGDAKAIHRRVKAKRPALCHMGIFDEYGSYAVEGFSTVLAQARSLGYSVCVSAQELGRLMKLQAEGEALVANTNIKFIMKIEDTRTSDEVQKRAAKEWVMTPGSLRKQYGTVKTTEYADSFSVQEREKLQILDLVALRPGEVYCIYENTLTKFQVPYVQGTPVSYMGVLKPVQLDRVVEVRAESPAAILAQRRRLAEIRRRNMLDAVEGIKATGRVHVPLFPDILEKLYELVGTAGVDIIFCVRLTRERGRKRVFIEKVNELRERYVETIAEPLAEQNGPILSAESELSRTLVRDAESIDNALKAL